MSDSYTITRHAHGIVIEGPFPVSDMGVLPPLWAEKYGYTICDSLIAERLRASMVVTAEESSKEWRRELGVD
jgi:hypothetical protein